MQYVILQAVFARMDQAVGIPKTGPSTFGEVELICFTESIHIFNAVEVPKMFTVRKAVLMVLSLVSTLSQSAPGDKHFSRTEHNRSTVSIPSTCIIKAKAMANSAIMTPTDKATSMAFISVLSQPGSSFRIDYALTPTVTQGVANNSSLTTREMALSQIMVKPPQAVGGSSAPSIASPPWSNVDTAKPSNSPTQTAPADSNTGTPQGAAPNTGAASVSDLPANPSTPSTPPATPASDQTPINPQEMTEISLAGYMGSTLINLVGVEGQSQAQAQVYNSIGDAQTVSASAGIIGNLVQTSSNQATIGLDILAGNIKRFVTDLGIHSDLRSQLDVQLNGGSTLTATDAGVPTTLTHAIGLADIINRIDIRATVTFDGTNLIVSTPVAAIGC